MRKEFLDKFVWWQKQQYSHGQKIVSLIVQGIFFLIVLPLILFLVSQKLDTLFTFSEFLQSPLNFYLGLLFFTIGLFLGFWAIWAQFQIGQGTPVPMMPTQKLVIKAPYTFCRNPMGLGTGVLLLGFDIIFNSFSFVLISIFLFILLLLYYKFIEEKELMARFGEEYLEYKKRTPFLIPTFRRKKSRKEFAAKEENRFGYFQTDTAS